MTENVVREHRSREVVSDTFITEYGDDNWHLMNTVGLGTECTELQKEGSEGI